MPFFWVCRVLGWIIAVAAIAAHMTHYKGFLGEFLSRENLNFYLMTSAFIEVNFQLAKVTIEHKKLLKSIDRGRE